MDIEKSFEILGLNPDAKLEDAKQAYRDLAKVWHPDRFKESRLKQKAEEKLKEINVAYKTVLSFLLSARPKPKQKAEKRDRREHAFRLTDVGNSKRLVARHGENIRYCHLEETWLCWNGRRWKTDTTGELMRLAKETVNGIFEEAKKKTDEKKEQAVFKHAMRSESEAKLRSMINLAQSEESIAILPENLDTDPWQFNVKNGTIDLRRGDLLPHKRSDLITKMAPVQFDSEANCPTWDEFLNQIMDGNENLIAFLKRAVGYTLTADTSEQCLFFLYGPGANGKSTFLETIRLMMGDYTKQTDFTTFLAKVDNIRNDLARLKGARFVSGVEAGAGKAFAEVFIKRVTGGDKITARFLYKEFFEFDPTFKVFLAANHRPTISGTDYAIWRRIMLIPFSVTIKKPIKRYIAKLKPELPGILNWAIEGCLEWQKKGLNVPEEVKLATQEYQAEMDILGDFVVDLCTIKPSARTTKTELYEAYEKWCNENKEQPVSKKTFGIRLTERGIISKKSGGTRYWSGIELHEERTSRKQEGPDFSKWNKMVSLRLQIQQKERTNAPSHEIMSLQNELDKILAQKELEAEASRAYREHLLRRRIEKAKQQKASPEHIERLKAKLNQLAASKKS